MCQMCRLVCELSLSYPVAALPAWPFQTHQLLQRTVAPASPVTARNPWRRSRLKVGGCLPRLSFSLTFSSPQNEAKAFRPPGDDQDPRSIRFVTRCQAPNGVGVVSPHRAVFRWPYSTSTRPGGSRRGGSLDKLQLTGYATYNRCPPAVLWSTVKILRAEGGLAQTSPPSDGRG